MKKPSERIAEIVNSFQDYRDGNMPLTQAKANSLIQYLDEEYEKNKPCEHKNTEPFCHEGMITCKDCRSVGLF